MALTRTLSVVCLLAAFHTAAFGSQTTSESPEQHASRFLALVEEATKHRTGPDAGKWTARVEEQHEDIRRALAWTFQHAPDDDVVRFATAVGLLWERSHLPEARQAVEHVLQWAKATPPTVKRAALLHRAGVLAFRQNDTATARARMEVSLAMARQLNDAPATALALTGLAQVALREDPAKVFAYADEAIAIYRQLNDLRGVGAPLHMKAEAARMMMDPRAEQMYEQALALSRELKDSRRVATELHNLAYVKLQKRKSGEADELFRESWTLFRELSVVDMDPYILAGLASVAAAEGRAERAAHLFGASEQLFATMKAAPDPADKVEMDRYAAVAKSKLGEVAYKAAYQKGRSLSTATAVELAQAR